MQKSDLGVCPQSACAFKHQLVEANICQLIEMLVGIYFIVFTSEIISYLFLRTGQKITCFGYLYKLPLYISADDEKMRTMTFVKYT